MTIFSEENPTKTSFLEHNCVVKMPTQQERNTEWEIRRRKRKKIYH